MNDPPSTAASSGLIDDRRSGAPSAEEIEHEARRCLRLQRAVDLSLHFIYQDARLSLGDTIEIVLHVRGIAGELFPGREETFDLLYRPRLMRAIRERFGIEEAALCDAHGTLRGG